MKNIFILYTFLCASIMLAQEKVLLRYNPMDSKSFVQTTKMTTVVSNNLLEMNITTVSNFQLSAKPTGIKSTVQLTHTYGTINRMGQKQSFDSKDPDFETSEIGKQYTEKLQNEFVQNLDNRGVSLEKTQNEPNNFTLLKYPKEALAVGDHWFMEQQIEGSEPTEYKYTLKQITEEDIILTLSLTKTNNNVSNEVKLKNAEGIITINRQTGIIRTTLFKMAMESQGMEIVTEIDFTNVEK